MPEAKNYTFDHTELAEVLIKHLGLRQGLWGVYVEFGLGAANVAGPNDPNSVTPAAINFVQKIGVQRFDKANNLTVDAASVGGKQRSKGKSKKS